MKNRFFESELKAADTSPEAFAAELKKIEENKNIKIEDYYNKLMRDIILRIEDEKLPALLNILVQRGVNLENRDSLGTTPLADLASFGKKEAVKFLIDSKANINDPIHPALCNAMYPFGQSQENRLEIIKILLEHKANINIQDKHSKSPLMLAADETNVEAMRYLLSQELNLFLKYTYAGGTMTALGKACKQYISAKYCVAHPEDIPSFHQKRNQDMERAKNCIELLVEAISNYLYREGFKEADARLYIKKAIKDLSGNFKEFDGEFSCNNFGIERLLTDNIQPDKLALRIEQERKERAHAFCMGTSLSKKCQEKKALPPPIFNFFQSDGEKDLTRKIFSYIHPMKHEAFHLPKKPRVS